MVAAHTSGGVTLQVAHIGFTAYGRARYRVLVRDEVQGRRLVFISEALEIPSWMDDRRALREAAGFLSCYADPPEGSMPEEASGVTVAELRALKPYAGKLLEISKELEALP